MGLGADHGCVVWWYGLAVLAYHGVGDEVAALIWVSVEREQWLGEHVGVENGWGGHQRVPWQHQFLQRGGH